MAAMELALRRSRSQRCPSAHVKCAMGQASCAIEFAFSFCFAFALSLPSRFAFVDPRCLSKYHAQYIIFRFNFHFKY